MSREVVTVSLEDRSYDIFFGTGLSSFFQEWVTRFYRGGSVFVVTDSNVHSIYGDDLRKWLSGISFDVLALPPGEEKKQWDSVREIYTFLARGGAGRESLVVAFGGGVVGDLAGFAAATYLRGIPYVQVPTTLLSQVDSSVGGKTGFNLAEGKNLVGAFHQPRAVFIDPTFLLTLDRRNLRAGMAEVVKCAFAGAPFLLDSITARAKTWHEMSGDAWIPVIRSAVAFKASVVERDEKESSTRRILNLGHTVGHALEQASGYRRLLHGEAVAMGLAWEAVFSRRQGVTPPGLERRLVDLLLALGFRLDDPEVPLSAVIAAIGRDKKRMVSEIDMPLLIGPGSCALRRIPISLLREALPAVRDEVRAILRDRTGETELAEGDVLAEEDFRATLAGTGDEPLSVDALERKTLENPRDLETLIALSMAYRREGNLSGSWETIKEALHLFPSSGRAQRIARAIEREMKEGLPGTEDRPSPILEDVVILEEGAFGLRPADRSSEERGEAGGIAPVSPLAGETDYPAEPLEMDTATPIRTVTMASVYWDQGRQEEAIRIIEEILRENPGDARALAWLSARAVKPEKERAGEIRKTGRERSVSSLIAFLEKTAKEYGYDVSRHH